MKISIITATKNNKAGLIRAIECVRNQTYKNVEHIIVDGGSTDGTREMMDDGRWLMDEGKGMMGDANNKELVIPANKVSQESTSDSGLRRNDHSSDYSTPLTTNYQLKTISEADSGIYDAINKGIKLATGEVIGLLHSDDLYVDENVIEKYASAFDQPTTINQLQTIEAVYSDLVYVRKKRAAKGEPRQGREGRSEKRDARSTELETTNHSQPTDYSIVRYWKAHKAVNSNQSSVKSKDTDHSSLVTDHLLRNGWMPPHPTLFIRKKIFEKYGLYNTDLKIASDYEMILRLFYKHKITSCYLPLTTYLMSIGGASNKSIGNILQKSKEDHLAMKMNGIPSPLFTLVYKNLRKLPQFLARDF